MLLTTYDISICIGLYTLLSEWYVTQFDTRDVNNLIVNTNIGNNVNWKYKLCSIFIVSISGPLLLPTNLDYTIQPLEILLSTLLHIVLTDIIFYHIHRLLHTNKYLYNTFHIHHHSPKHMDAYVGTHEHPIETLLARVLPFITWTYIFTLHSNNVISWLISVLTVIFITIVGHSGYKPTYHVLFICPFLLLLRLIPESQNGLEHEMHHKYYNCNYSSFLRVWDDFYGTSYNDIKRFKTDVHSFIRRIVILCLCFIFPIEMLFLYVMYNIFLILRRNNINEVYYPNCIYGYHPHGILSLPAFLTFAWGDIPTTFAVRDSITWLPGTCSVDMSSLKKIEGSYAIALDGRIGFSNRIIKRRGFCTLGKRLCPCLVLDGTYDIVFGDVIEYEEDHDVLQKKYYDGLQELADRYNITLTY